MAQDGTMGQVLAFLLPPEKEVDSERYLELSSEPLSKCAWALQERLMAQRILHYCADQVYYEYNQEFVSEDGFPYPGRYCSLFEAADSVWVTTNSQHSADHAVWYYIPWGYDARELGEPSYKLPTMSGLARLFESRIRASYVAGLWSNALIEGLAWQGLRPAKTAPIAQAYIAPWWSWASFDGIAATLGKGWTDIAKFIDYQVEPRTSNPYGELKDGWIRIRAPLAFLSLGDEPEQGEFAAPYRLGILLKTARGDRLGDRASFDNIDREDDLARDLVRSLELFVLVPRRADPEEEVQEKGEDEDVVKNEEREEDQGGGEDKKKQRMRARTMVIILNPITWHLS
jgi:hypothetical protein